MYTTEQVYFSVKFNSRNEGAQIEYLVMIYNYYDKGRRMVISVANYSCLASSFEH